MDSYRLYYKSLKPHIKKPAAIFHPHMCPCRSTNWSIWVLIELRTRNHRTLSFSCLHSAKTSLSYSRNLSLSLILYSSVLDLAKLSKTDPLKPSRIFTALQTFVYLRIKNCPRLCIGSQVTIGLVTLSRTNRSVFKNDPLFSIMETMIQYFVFSVFVAIVNKVAIDATVTLGVHERMTQNLLFSFRSSFRTSNTPTEKKKFGFCLIIGRILYVFRSIVVALKGAEQRLQQKTLRYFAVGRQWIGVGKIWD